MSVDVLQNRIRKTKSALMLRFDPVGEELPAPYNGEERWEIGYELFARTMLQGLRGKIPGVRFSFSCFAMLGSEGLGVLERLCKAAQQLGYYTLLEVPAESQIEACAYFASRILGQDGPYPCSGVVVSSFHGSDVLKAFAAAAKQENKTVFSVVRTPNRSGSEVQDLLSGARLVHFAAADRVNHLAGQPTAKCGYCQIGLGASATAASSLRNLRTAYPNLFLLVDGLEQPSGNMKNCSHAFDRLGHGAAICVEKSVLHAWSAAPEQDCVTAAVAQIERLNRTLQNYISIL